MSVPLSQEEATSYSEVDYFMRNVEKAIERVQTRVSVVEGDLLDHHEREGVGVVLGLDASLTSYGFSALGAGSLSHVTMRFRPKLKGVDRLQEIYSFVGDMAIFFDRLFGIKEIVMEDYAPMAKGKTYSIGEGGGVSKLALLHELGETKIAYPTLVRPTTLKKYVTSRGNAKKNEMLLAVYRKWDVEFSNDDMSDAYSLARMGLALLFGKTEYEYEREVVSILERNTECRTS